MNSQSLENRLRLAEAAMLKNGFKKLDDIWVAPSKATQPTDAERITQAAAKVIDGYADNYDTLQRISSVGTLDYRTVAHDLRTNIKGGVAAAIAAASANGVGHA